jgi:hypothetical protein
MISVPFQLTPVERYAVVYIEDQMAPVATEELEKAEVMSDIYW